MSADLQVEEPPRRLRGLTATTGAREAHVWDRAFGPWDLYFGLVWVATAAFVPPAPGYGLRGLRARAAEVGGTASIDSAVHTGTTVTVTLPIR